MYKFNQETLLYEEVSIKKYILVSILLTLGIVLLIGATYPTKIQYITLPPDVDTIYINTTKPILNIERIGYIESRHNDSAISNDGGIGWLQITPICLQEWNNCHKDEQYSTKDLYNRKINKKIGKWVLNNRIPFYLKHYKIPNNTNYKLIIYNSGINNFLKWYKEGANYSNLNKESSNYLLKYWE